MPYEDDPDVNNYFFQEQLVPTLHTHDKEKIHQRCSHLKPNQSKLHDKLILLF